MKIVIVEDEIRIREGLGRLVRKLDQSYEVIGEAGNGEEGCRLIREQCPDVIITDIKMPLMDGLEMLTVLYDEGIKAKAVVLSAYSEFEYARQAMRMGVKEYLLKPIVVSELSESLRRVHDELDIEKTQPESMYESVEQVFAGIFTGTLEADRQMRSRLEEHYQIPADSTYQGICLYLGKWYEKEKDAEQKKLQKLLKENRELSYLLLEIEQERSLLVLVYQNEKKKELERFVQYWLLQAKESRGVAGFITDLRLEDLRKGINTLLSYMDWNISFGDGVMISYPKITKLQTNPCIYPMDLETQMKLAVCAGQKEKIQHCFQKFTRYFNSEKIYYPKEIKECYVRFLWAFMNTAKEVGLLSAETFEQQKLLEQIMNAKTTEELTDVEEFVLSRVQSSQEEIWHLTVKRAQSMIQEFYHTGITLEEIATKLNITPEYLGTRFHQEIGQTFSSYIKNFRMQKAKELLIGTNLKLYEIAQKVGYSDPKYFSRVFRETTGQLPADYRKIHK